jgi:ribosomal protein S18 acetylase RimI-like enzyme
VFCCRHALVLDVGGNVAGMQMGYRLPDADHAETMLRRCESLRPVNWLERRPPSTYYLNTLSLYPEHQKQGYGGLLLGAAEAQARRNSCACIILETARGNQGAARFYRRQGFVPWSADGGGPLTLEQDAGSDPVFGKWLFSAVV